MAPKVKGVIFDMDGLMFDTERIWDQFFFLRASRHQALKQLLPVL